MTKDKRRIQSCIDHINTAVDVDPWAKELVIEMGKEVLKYAKDINVPNNDCISRQAAIDFIDAGHLCNPNEPRWSDNEVVNFLKSRPSVQPEPSEMTDEQAILHLQSTGWMQNHDREMYESGLREQLADDSGGYDSLIPCEDTISRQDAIRWVKTECNPYGKPTLDFESGKRVMEHLKIMPSVQLERKWIPVTERLPEKPNMYTVTDSKGDVVRFIYTATKSSRECWKRCAKAWMPLPEPYREEGEQDGQT